MSWLRPSTRASKYTKGARLGVRNIDHVYLHNICTNLQCDNVRANDLIKILDIGNILWDNSIHVQAKDKWARRKGSVNDAHHLSRDRGPRILSKINTFQSKIYIVMGDQKIFNSEMKIND